VTVVLAGHRVEGRQELSTGRTVFLHLAPGAAAMAVYVAAAPVARHLGLPTVAALAVSGLLGVAPVQLAVLARTRRSGEPVIRLRTKLPVPQVLAWMFVEAALAAVAFALTARCGGWLKDTVFGWWPAGWALDPGTGGGFGRGALLITAALVLLGSVVVAPVVEEIYFRGYLLSRMGTRFGLRTPVTHAARSRATTSGRRGWHRPGPWLSFRWRTSPAARATCGSGSSPTSS
jgi:membrane protease YdiL (CAAX protease family)